MVERYFTRVDGNYQVNKQVRGMVVFGEHDLAQRAAFPRIDMVLSRNVLIYFTQELQKRALQLFAYSLRDGGRLVLGKAESVSPLDEFFTADHQRLNVFSRRGERFLMPPALLESPAPTSRANPPASGRGTDNPPQRRTEASPQVQTKREQEQQRLSQAAENARARREQEEQRVEQAVENLLLRSPVGTVVVDRSYDIRLINDVARRLLSIHRPVTGEDLIHLLQSGAYTELRPSIDAAFRQGDTVEIPEFTLEEPTTGRPRYLRVAVHPRKPESEEGVPENVIVLIIEVTDLARTREKLRERVESVEAELEQQKSLNQRLGDTNRELEESNQGLNRANEELQTSNEELLISTEEAQASTEEVETLNEELQATNEELNTTNDDLEARSNELRELAQESEEKQSWLTAILESISNDVAVVVVDAAGNVIFRNTACKLMFGEGDPDLRGEEGQPLSPEATPWRRAAREESFTASVTIMTEGGGLRHFEVTGQPLQGEGQRGGVIVIRDLREE